MNTLLKIREVAKILGVAQNTVRRLQERNELKPAMVLPSGHRRWTQEQVETFKRQIYG